MDKREFSASILVIGLTVLFSLASLALYISRGKSKFWTAKKMKLGAMILSLTAIVSTQKACITCYDPVEPENTMYAYLADTINLNDSTRIIEGEIDNRVGLNFSYRLLNDTTESLSYSENISAKDGSFDDYSEAFIIELDTGIQTGDYLFQLFDVDKDEQNNADHAQFEQSLHIKKE